jgi:hypothetical protein
MKDHILEYHPRHISACRDFARPNLGFAKPVTIFHFESPFGCTSMVHSSTFQLSVENRDE